MLILQYPFGTASLPPSPSESNFPLANWNSYSMQSSSCSSSISVFFPTPFDHTPQLLDIPNHMTSQVCHSIWQAKFVNLYSIQNVLNSLQSSRCSFTFTTLIVHAITLARFTRNPLPHFSYFSPPYSTLTCS